MIQHYQHTTNQSSTSQQKLTDSFKTGGLRPYDDNDDATERGISLHPSARRVAINIARQTTGATIMMATPQAPSVANNATLSVVGN